MDPKRSPYAPTTCLGRMRSGQRLNQYVIEQPLGSGGMGVVYLAQDTRLNRKVAIKFLQEHHSRDPQGVSRFVREAQAAASLSHPHIVTVHEVGEVEGCPFLVMEYVQGNSVADLSSGSSLSLQRVVELAKGICEGLQAAHAKGVVHRDIKPSNIMVDAHGRPKILDFGLAFIQGAEELTQPGTAMGTIRYMAPEQIQGRPPDSRSDLFSLGIVLYELIAGRHPFERDNLAATLHAICNELPAALSVLRSEVPSQLQELITKLLEPEPARRYSAASEVLAGLVQIAALAHSDSVHEPSRRNAIVVLPFDNLSPDPDSDYFADGLTEEVITDLGKIHSLWVLSRKSSLQLKGTSKDIRVLARELGVRYVLMGSIRRMNDQLRVNAALIEASQDRQLWAERFNGTMRDVFDIQEQVARSVAQVMECTLNASADIGLAERPIKHPRAYDLYLRARQQIERWNREGLDSAFQCITEALRLEPQSHSLHAALGYCYYSYVNLGFHQEESLENAKVCLNRAIELNPRSVEALRLQGVMHLSLLGDARGGVRLLEQALQYSPHDCEAMWWLGLSYLFRGKPNDAIKISCKLRELEPLVIMSSLLLPWAFFFDGRFEQGWQELQLVHESDPDNFLVQFSRALFLMYLGRPEEAAEFIELSKARPSLTLFDRLILIQLYAMRGERAKVDEMLTDQTIISVRRDIQYPWHVAVAYAILGEFDAAIEWLEVAIDNGFSNFRFLSELDPFLQPLRDLPSFERLVQKARQEYSSA
jgi:serine/threonine protein kinase/tetratricopeptide (TPR) repeat protein